MSDQENSTNQDHGHTIEAEVRVGSMPPELSGLLGAILGGGEKKKPEIKVRALTEEEFRAFQAARYVPKVGDLVQLNALGRRLFKGDPSHLVPSFVTQVLPSVFIEKGAEIGTPFATYSFDMVLLKSIQKDDSEEDIVEIFSSSTMYEKVPEVGAAA